MGRSASRKRRREQGSDQLTGLPTRAALLKYLEDGFAAQRKQLTVLLGDIDGFSRVNDLFGRSTGDELLEAGNQHFAQ